MSNRTKTVLSWILALTFLTPLLYGQAVGDADRQRFEQIRARVQRGEQVTPEERQFAQPIMARMKQSQAAPKK
jgi:hypothetical protein